MTQVLVADDNPDIRSAIEAILDLSGYTTVQASNGIAALEIMSTGNIDLVVLDIFMPEKDGIEVLRERHNLGLATNPPVLAISGGGENGTANLGLTAARALGASAILYKPFSSADLTRAIQSILN